MLRALRFPCWCLKNPLPLTFFSSPRESGRGGGRRKSQSEYRHIFPQWLFFFSYTTTLLSHPQRLSNSFQKTIKLEVGKGRGEEKEGESTNTSTYTCTSSTVGLTSGVGWGGMVREIGKGGGGNHIYT